MTREAPIEPQPRPGATPAPAIEASFPCSICGREAARLVLVPRGGYDRIDVAHEPLVDAPRYLVDAAGFGMSHALLPAGDGVHVSAIAAALADRDVTELWRINPEFAPMWCPSCRAVYCSREWALWTVYADDDPAWFEELRGRCPSGHERRIYD